MADEQFVDVEVDLLNFVQCDAFDVVLRRGDQPVTKRIYVWGLVEMQVGDAVMTQAVPLVPQGSVLVPMSADEDVFIRIKPHAEGLCDTDYDMARELARMETEQCEKPALKVASADEPSVEVGSASN